jgi:hypothetical protein
MLTQTDNIDEIILITQIPIVIRRRLTKECKSLIKTCNKIVVKYSHNEDIIVNVYKKEENILNLYSFKIPIAYPFNSPRFIINSIPQNEFFDLKTNRFRNILRYIKGITCLCCHSCISRTNWTPAITIENIINQLIEYKKIKYNIGLKIMSDKIKEKYLISDIDLDSWLFEIPKPRFNL